MRRLTMVFVTTIFLSIGCVFTLATSKEGFVSSELKRASFDMDCPQEKLDVVELEGGAYSAVMGVTGCGRKATYKYINRVGWVAQTLSGSPAAGEAAKQ